MLDLSYVTIFQSCIIRSYFLRGGTVKFCTLDPNLLFTASVQTIHFPNPKFVNSFIFLSLQGSIITLIISMTVKFILFFCK